MDDHISNHTKCTDHIMHTSHTSHTMHEATDIRPAGEPASPDRASAAGELEVATATLVAAGFEFDVVEEVDRRHLIAA